MAASRCVPSSPSRANTFQRFAAITANPAKSAVCFSECAVKPLHPHWFFISSKMFSQSPITDSFPNDTSPLTRRGFLTAETNPRYSASIGRECVPKPPGLGKNPLDGGPKEGFHPPSKGFPEKTGGFRIDKGRHDARSARQHNANIFRTLHDAGGGERCQHQIGHGRLSSARRRSYHLLRHGNASALPKPDFHLKRSANRHFTLCLQECRRFLARKNGEPPTPPPTKVMRHSAASSGRSRGIAFCSASGGRADAAHRRKGCPRVQDPRLLPDEAFADTLSNRHRKP